jgi:hypothetical protein
MREVGGKAYEKDVSSCSRMMIPGLFGKLTKPVNSVAKSWGFWGPFPGEHEEAPCAFKHPKFADCSASRPFCHKRPTVELAGKRTVLGVVIPELAVTVMLAIKVKDKLLPETSDAYDIDEAKDMYGDRPHSIIDVAVWRLQ